MQDLWKKIELAHERIKPHIHRTPILTSSAINRIAGGEILFKCENFQKAGAFKMRGALNAILQLDETVKNKGVATHSSGNHGGALALAARLNSIKAYVVMPETAPQIKENAVREYGATVIKCRPTLQAREETLEKVIRQYGAIFIHPYNNFDVLAGQGTAAKELLEEFRDLDFVIAPVGGGGLLSGTALSVHNINPRTIIIGAEPQGADDAKRSLIAGKIIPSVNPDTIADGLLTSLGDKTFPIIKKHVKDIITVSDAEIISAMRLIWERMKIIVESSSATVLAVVMKNKEMFQGKKTGVILSGGNVDLSNLPW